MTRSAIKLLILMLAAASPARAADDIIAVLSVGSGAYMEAYSSFRAQYGEEVPYFDLSRQNPRIPSGVKTIVAFGSRAAAYRYPQGADLVYALAPGFFLNHGSRTGRTVKISMRPSPAALLAKLKEIQPPLKRLRIFMASSGYKASVDDYTNAGSALGLEVSVASVESPEKLPGLLRGALGQVDAFWLPPDPKIISPASLMIFREFSWANHIPMYAATKGLTREGACASLGVSFAHGGIAAAAAAKALRRGEDLPGLIYPDKTELTINASSGKKCGIEFSQELLKQAAYLFP